MKTGLYFAKEPDASILEELQKKFTIHTVDKISDIKKKFFNNEYDFVFLQNEELLDALKCIQVATALDDQIVFVSPKKLEFPSIANHYILGDSHMNRTLISILSFHQAKMNAELQEVFTVDNPTYSHFFYMAESSPLGTFLTDAEDSLFYINEVAQNILNYEKEHSLMRHYLNLKAYKETEEYLEDGRCYYPSVPVIDSDLNVSVLINDIKYNDEKIGAVYYIEDVTHKEQQSQQMKREYGKYLSLSSRLNDVLLKDPDTNSYKLSYLKRKIDIEIKHAKGLEKTGRVVYFGVRRFKNKNVPFTRKKTIYLRAVQFLVEKFPDPHLVGVLHDGHWLVVLQGDAMGMPDSFTPLCEQLQDFLNLEFKDVEIELQVKEIDDLKRFSDSQDLLKSWVGI